MSPSSFLSVVTESADITGSESRRPEPELGSELVGKSPALAFEAFAGKSGAFGREAEDTSDPK
jgi:hypothetical protein